MKIDKSSNLYEACERVAKGCKSDGDRNLTAQDTATIMLYTVLNSILDTGKSVEELLAKPDDEPAPSAENAAFALKWRKETRDMLKPLATASNNFQNTVMADDENGLMKSVKAAQTKIADLV